MDTPISRAQTPNNASDDAAQRDAPDPPRRVVDDPIQTDATSYVVQPSPDDIEAITTRFRRLTGLRLCSWQAFVTAVCNTGKKDLFVLAPPGAGKTLAFLAPLIFNPHHIVVIICPLIALGSQHFKSCVALGISAIELTAKTATNANYKDIARCLFRVIIAPPEVANRDPRFVKLFKVNAFALRFYRVIADEVHCVEEWSDFRPQYLNFDLLLHWLPPRARFLCASATVTDALRARIMKTFRLQPKTTELIRLNNDCPNIFFAVRKMSGTPTNYNDLLSLLPSDPDLIAYDCPPPPKFMVFMPSKKECVEATLFLMHHLPLHSVGRICWFFSDCSEGYKNKMLQDLKDGKIWGMFCTDSAGMGIDVPDVRIVIQWGIKNVTFATLYQRIGRGGRDRSLQALALVYVENAHWPDDGKGKAPLKTSVKREAPDDEIPSKRVKIEEKENSIPLPSSTNPPPSSRKSKPAPSKLPVAKARKTNLKPWSKPAETDPVVLEFVSRQPVSSTWSPPTARVARAVSAISRPVTPVAKPATFFSSSPEPPPRVNLRTPSPEPIVIDSDDETASLPPTPVQWCRRSVPRRHFHSHDVHAPEPESPDCKRCVPCAPTICCDLHIFDEDGGLPDSVPAFIRRFLLHEAPEKAPRGPNKTGIKKAFVYGDKEDQLMRSLRDWRDGAYRELFSRSLFGSVAILSDELIKRIAGIAHLKGLATIEQLRFQTDWELCARFGEQLLPLIEAVFPGQHGPEVPARAAAPVLGSVPFVDLTNLPVGGDGDVVKKPRAAPRCSACLEAGSLAAAVGHTKASQLCPQKHLTNTRRAELKPSASPVVAMPAARAAVSIPSGSQQLGTSTASHYRAGAVQSSSGSYYRTPSAPAPSQPVAGPSRIPQLIVNISAGPSLPRGPRPTFYNDPTPSSLRR